MLFLIKYVRYIILVSSMVIAIALFTILSQNSLHPATTYVTISDAYGLLAVLFLYLSLLASPLYIVFKKFPFKPVYIKARRALGVSAFLFAVLHAVVSFTQLLGGFSSLKYLGGETLFALFISIISLLILCVLTITSLDYFVRRLGKMWKPIHRFVYVAGIFTVIHALLLGSHFVNIFGFIPLLFFIALAFLGVLETIRFAQYIQLQKQKTAA